MPGRRSRRASIADTARQQRLTVGLNWARLVLDLTQIEIAQVLGVTRRTIIRWRLNQHRPQPRLLDELDRLSALAAALRPHFGKDEFPEVRGAIHRWLLSPLSTHGYRTPRQVLVSAGGLEALIALLSAAERAGIRVTAERPDGR